MLTKARKQRWTTIAGHLSFWVIWNVAYYFSTVVQGWDEHFWFHNRWLMPIDLSAVYVTAYFLVPRFLLKKGIPSFLLVFVPSLVFFVLVERAVYYYIIYPAIYPPRATEVPFLYFPALLSVFLGMYSFVFLFSGFKLFRSWFKEQQRHNELEKQNLKSELAMLRAQVNPHFLFNTLNNIDSLVFIDQQRASDAIHKLSEIMRYMLYEANTDRVPLDREIHYLGNMIDLMRLRLKDPAFIAFRVEGDPVGKTIPPMLLAPFIENAYKHGAKQGASPGIEVTILIKPDRFCLSVHNQYDPNRAGKDEIGGIGLVNVKRRLDLLYGKNYVFTINDRAPDFRIDLCIPHQTKVGVESRTALTAGISSNDPALHPVQDFSPS